MAHHSDKKALDPVKSHTAGEQPYHMSIWLGAVCRYLLNLGRIPFESLHSPVYKNRNLWTGYIARLVLIGGIIVAAIWITK